MVRLVHEVFHHVHDWRDIRNNQLKELYISVMVRTLGLSLIGIFIPVFLYQLNYSLQQIALYYMTIYFLRIFVDVLSAKLIGYFGPKHMILVSNLFTIVSLILFLTLESHAWPLWVIAFSEAFAVSLFFMAYHIEFSKIQSSKHGGQQLGTMFKAIKLAAATGPLLGGLLATLFNLQIVIGLAMLFILASVVPLTYGPEAVRKHQHVSWNGFPWPAVWRDILANIGLGTDQMVTLYLWPLYVAFFIFSDNVYLSVGLITSISLVVSVVSASFYGRLIDKKAGNRLMEFGIAGSSLGHVLRMYISTSGFAYLFNVVNDSLSIAVRMPFTRGLYVAASSHEGYRNAYMATILISSNITRFATFTIVYLIAGLGSDQLAIQTAFLIASIGIWTTYFHNFKALR